MIYNEEEGGEEEDNLIMIENHKMKKCHKHNSDAIFAKRAFIWNKIVGSKANLNVIPAKVFL